jgi:hypothetical protein
MTARSTPTTKEPTRQESAGIGTTSAPAFDAQRRPDSRRSAIWLVWAGITAVLATAIWLVIAGVAGGYEPVASTRVNDASSARLQGAADQYEAARSTRADQASTARLQGLADQYHSTP